MHDGLFYGTVSIQTLQHWVIERLMNGEFEKLHKGTLVLAKSKYYPNICLQGQRKATKSLLGYLLSWPCTSLQCYRYTRQGIPWFVTLRKLCHRFLACKCTPLPAFSNSIPASVLDFVSESIIILSVSFNFPRIRLNSLVKLSLVIVI